MKNKIKELLNESLIYELIETMIQEDYPTTFNMDEFKSLNNFSKRIKYCETHLKKISSGSSRIVYMIDSTKVLKLAKNEKGVAQCEVEIQWGNESYFGGILAETLDSHPDGLWVEMELARKVKVGDFKRLYGINFRFLDLYLRNKEQENKGARRIFGIEPELEQQFNENEFVNELVDLMYSMDAPAGDLGRLNSYGLVNRDGEERIVLIDFGLTSKVYRDYYARM